VVRKVVENDNDMVQRFRLTPTEVGGRMRMGLIFEDSSMRFWLIAVCYCELCWIRMGVYL
jgi:hypothetical protein